MNNQIIEKGFSMLSTEFYLKDYYRGLYIPVSVVIKNYFGNPKLKGFKKWLKKHDLHLAIETIGTKECISLRALAKYIDCKRPKNSLTKVKQMNIPNLTKLGLLEKYDNFLIPLEVIAKDFFNCSVETARNKLNQGKLDMCAFRLGDQKSPMFVHVDDLTSYIDNCRSNARKSIDKALEALKE